MTPLGWLACLCAFLPLRVLLENLFYRRRPLLSPDPPGRVSVLIPARNEANNIADCLASCLANDHPAFEVIVLDDHSGDGTAALVREAARNDGRVRLASAPPLPPGLSGKAHACGVLASLAQGELLLFIDADVRLEAQALRRLDGYMAAHPEMALASGVPRQIMRSPLEWLVVPMINFLMWGYMPLWRMRRLADPSYAGACGQLMLARAGIYREVGGHAAIGASLHDGVDLARLFRRHGHFTDFIDASGVASCRMYCGAREVWEGFAKNASEGLATPAGLPVWTILLAGGGVLPVVLAAMGSTAGGIATAMMLAAATGIALVGRINPLAALLHPFGVCVLLAIQWQSFIAARLGRKRRWKGRDYDAV